MNDKQLQGLPVITQSEGERLGKVERAYVDPSNQRIVGFAYTAGGGFLQPESSPMVDTSEVAALDETALTVSAAAPRGTETAARYVELIDLHELSGRDVLTEDGTSLGHIVASTFDENTFALTGFELSSGSLFAKHSTVPADRVVTIGSEVLVVRGEDAPSDAAAAPVSSEPDRQPFQEESFEIPFRRQELSVRKEIRLAEEVIISKEAYERAEQVADTVRRERVHLTERSFDLGATTGSLAGETGDGSS